MTKELLKKQDACNELIDYLIDSDMNLTDRANYLDAVNSIRSYIDEDISAWNTQLIDTLN